MKNTILSLVAFVLLSTSLFAQAPQSFKYQAVVRDASGAILSTQPVGMQLTILQGGPSGTIVYSETFATTTNSYGLVDLGIGQGTTVDDFTAIDWANGPFFIEIGVDVTGGTSYSVMGTSELLSVPYALYAEQAETVTNDQVDDADADPSNEIQALTLSNDTLYLSNGGQVYLGDYAIDLVDDADADPTNEYNTSVVLNGTDLETTDGGGTIVTDLSSLQDGVNDADSDPTNELQDWTTLPGIPAGFADDIDDVDDADADPTNEIQDISLVGNDLSISGGSTITLPDDNDWIISGNDLYNANTGNVGIGTATPNYALHTHTDVNSIHQFTTTSTGTSVLDGFLLGNNSLNDAYIIQREAANLFIRTNNTDRITINSNGNVGIGIATASGELDVAGPGVNEPSVLVRNGNSVGTNSAVQIGLGYANTDQYQHFITTRHNAGSTTNNSIDFYTSDGTPGGTQATSVHNLSLNGGKVGIGTNFPNYALHTHTDVNTYHQFTTTSTGTTVNDGLLIGNNSLNDAYIIQREAANLFIRTNNTDRITIDAAGNVGVGTSTPSATLDVEGTMQYVDGNQSNGKVLVSDASGNASWGPLATLKQPDGIAGMTPITHQFTSGNYVVPAGKNLYIMSAYNPYGGEAITANGLEILNHIMSNSGATGGTSGFMAAPIILGPGTILSVTGNPGKSFNGYLVDASVVPVLVSNNYTVPAGFNFVLTSANIPSGGGWAQVRVNGIVLNTTYGNENGSNNGNFAGLKEPLFVSSGQTVDFNGGGGTKMLNGYLIAQ